MSTPLTPAPAAPAGRGYGAFALASAGTREQIHLMAWALIQLAASMVLVGVNVVVAKALAAALPVPLILFLRCGLASLLLVPWVARARLPAWGLAANLALQALVGTLGYNMALLAGLRLTGALEAGLVLAALPAVMAVGSAAVLGERLSGRRWAAVALATGGMAALTLGRGGGGGGGGGSAEGDALVFAAVCCEAGYMLLSKRSAARIGTYAGAFWMQAFGTLMLVPLVPGDLLRFAPLVATPRITGLLAFHSITTSLLAIVLWYGGMRRAPANLAGVFTVLLPASAAALAVVVLGERMTGALAVGFALMLVSILVATWPGRQGSAL